MNHNKQKYVFLKQITKYCGGAHSVFANGIQFCNTVTDINNICNSLPNIDLWYISNGCYYATEDEDAILLHRIIPVFISTLCNKNVRIVLCDDRFTMEQFNYKSNKNPIKNAILNNSWGYNVVIINKTLNNSDIEQLDSICHTHMTSVPVIIANFAPDPAAAPNIRNVKTLYLSYWNPNGNSNMACQVVDITNKVIYDLAKKGDAESNVKMLCITQPAEQPKHHKSHCFNAIIEEIKELIDSVDSVVTSSSHTPQHTNFFGKYGGKYVPEWIATHFYNVVVNNIDDGNQIYIDDMFPGLDAAVVSSFLNEMYKEIPIVYKVTASVDQFKIAVAERTNSFSTFADMVAFLKNKDVCEIMRLFFNLVTECILPPNSVGSWQQIVTRLTGEHRVRFIFYVQLYHAIYTKLAAHNKQFASVEESMREFLFASQILVVNDVHNVHKVTYGDHNKIVVFVNKQSLQLFAKNGMTD